MAINKHKLVRILHVVGGMSAGGVETWLMHVLRHMDRKRYRFDFLTHTLASCFYDEEIRSLGCRVLPCPDTKRPWRYAASFSRILEANGPYDVVHSHVHHYSGFVLMLAQRVGVPIRIAHSHADLSCTDRHAAWLRRLYLWGTERLIRRHATVGLACSRLAALALFGKGWERDSRLSVLPYGIDLAPFSCSVDHAAIRREFGIPDDAFVVGHVGRFARQKNHVFLVDIFYELALLNPQARLLLIGTGPLRKPIEEKVAKLNLTGKVIFAGVRADIPRVMLGAMDVFLFPSLYEGLPIVLIEAQAAGLPCVVSDRVSPEASIVPGLTTVIDLKMHASAWAQVLAKHTRTNPPADPLVILRDSSFNITNCVRGLEGVYSIVNHGGN